MLPSLLSKARNVLSHHTFSRLILQEAALQDLPLAKKNSPLSACIPVALIGGTALLYKAVLDHPSSTSLTPLSLFYLVLLASQYAIQPQLSKQFISPKTVKTSLTLTEELIKATLAMIGLFCSASGSIPNILKQWNWLESIQAAGIPAALYAVQGILQYTAYLNLDAVTYNGLSQTKVFSSALACALLFGQYPTQRQSLALLLLVASTLIFQGTWVLHRQQKEHNKDSGWWFRGVVPCVGSTLFSGVAGALSQKGLQHGGRNAYLFTLEVSAYSAVSAFGLSHLRRFVVHGGSSSEGSIQSNQDKDDSLFHDWTIWTILPVLCKAMGGVLTALVHKYAGSVSKGFALTLGLVLSTGLSDRELQLHQLMGTILVMLSSWLHFSIPKAI